MLKTRGLTGDGKVSGEGFYHGEVKESSDGVEETVD